MKTAKNANMQNRKVGSSGQKTATGFTLDTCAVIRICENPNVADMLTCRIDFTGIPVYCSSKTIEEAERLGHDKDTIISVLTAKLGTKILYGRITEQMRWDAIELERIYPTLHPGDSQILAFNMAKSAILISRDNGLIAAAVEAGSEYINPDTMASDATESRIRRIIRKTAQPPRKVKSVALEHGKKIVWNTFN